MVPYLRKSSLIRCCKFILFSAYIFFFHSCSSPNVNSKHAMVVSAHPLASKVGLEILKQGGNAVDAAVAVQFALAVVYPSAGNIGGGGFFVYRSKQGEFASLDFREKAPSGSCRDMYLDSAGNVIENLSLKGHLASGVPGTVDGMVEIHDSLGNLNWETLIQPAIDLAYNGFSLTLKEAEKLTYFTKYKIIDSTYNPYYKPNYVEGDTLILSDLAQTLEAIRDFKRDGFYSGKVADKFVEEMKNNYGLISYDDLVNYTSVWRDPIVFRYKNYNIISMGPPSSGGIALAQMLKMISNFDLKDFEFHSRNAVHLMCEIEKRAFADRSIYLGDPDFYNVPVESLMDTYYLNSRMDDFKLNRATSADSLYPGKFDVEESEETTHFSIVDEDGNAVSITTTLNGSFGSGVVVKNAGFLLNNEMDDFSIKPGHPNLYGLIGGEANAISPNKRMLSSMTPTIIEKNDSLFMVLGSPGGSSIITAVFQTVLNVIDYKMDVQSAVNAPRFHHQWKPDYIKLENDFKENDSLIFSLKKKGHRVRFVTSMNRVDAILVNLDSLYGGADKRGDDYAASY